MKKTKGYYARRAIDKEIRLKKLGDIYLKDLEEVFTMALNGINKDIRRFMQDISQEDILKTINIKVEKSELDKTSKELKEYINTHNISEEHLNNIIRLYNNGKLNRMALMQLQIRQRLQLISEYESKGTKKHLEEVYKESFYETSHMLYDYETGLFNFEKLNNLDTFIENSFSIINTKAIEEALKEKYHNKSFMNRIKKNNKNFTDFVYKVFLSEIAQGKSIDQITKVMQQHLKNRFSNAKTIVRTESNRFNAMGTQKAYEASELKKYVFIATLDMKTSTLCQNLDQEIFLVKEQKIGVNCNPMHPNCRSTTAPYTESRPFSRTARRVINNESYDVEGGTKYKDWYESLTKNEKDHIEYLKRVQANKKYDKEQFNNWKKTLKEEAPKTFKSFKDIKYKDKEKYVALKKKYKEALKENKKDKIKKEIGRGRNKIKSKRIEAIVDKKNANKTNLKRKFKELLEKDTVTEKLTRETKKILKQRDGTRVESLLMINSETEEIARNYSGNINDGVKATKKQLKLLNDSQKYTIIALHNHPRSSPPSVDDLKVAWLRKYKYGLIVCHDGRVIKYGFDFDKVKDENKLLIAIEFYNIRYKNFMHTKEFILSNKENFQKMGIYIDVLGE